MNKVMLTIFLIVFSINVNASESKHFESKWTDISKYSALILDHYFADNAFTDMQRMSEALFKTYDNIEYVMIVDDQSQVVAYVDKTGKTIEETFKTGVVRKMSDDIHKTISSSHHSSYHKDSNNQNIYDFVSPSFYENKYIGYIRFRIKREG